MRRWYAALTEGQKAVLAVAFIPLFAIGIVASPLAVLYIASRALLDAILGSERTMENW